MHGKSMFTRARICTVLHYAKSLRNSIVAGKFGKGMIRNLYSKPDWARRSRRRIPARLLRDIRDESIAVDKNQELSLESCETIDSILQS